MADISRSRAIIAQPQAIWDVLADFGSIGAWVPIVDHSCLLNHGREGAPVGTTRRVQVGRNAVVERIIEFDQPSALAYGIEGLPSRLRTVVNRWTLRPCDHGTDVTVTSRVEIGTNPVARAAEWVVCRGMAKGSDSMLAGLARRTENTHD